MEVHLDGKLMLITGASSGIGKEIAFCAARAGADIALNYLSDESEAKKIAREIEGYGRRCIPLQADVSLEADVIGLFARLEGEFGRQPDILVNNAGSMVSRCPIAEMDVAVWDDVIRINLRSIFLCCREALRAMIPQRHGVIINISSISAYTGGGPGAVAYAATKGGMNSFTTGLAKEAARHTIRVVSVGPGVIDTPFHDKFTPEERRAEFEKMIPLGRLGVPSDIAPMVVFLASDLASFVTGHHFYVTGGM